LNLFGQPLMTSDADAASPIVARARSYLGTPHEIAVTHLCHLGFVNISLRERLEHDNPPSTVTP